MYNVKAVADIVKAAAAELNAVPDERIHGLWHAPGYPELTTRQLVAAVDRLPR